MIDDDDLVQDLNAAGYAILKPVGALMKAKDVWIAYDTNETGQIDAVLVTDDEREWRRRCDDFRMTSGRCYSDWMVPLKKREDIGFAPDQCFDPTGVFGTLLSHGFASRGVFREVLVAFARIEECDWARRMLFAIDGEWSNTDLNRNF